MIVMRWLRKLYWNLIYFGNRHLLGVPLLGRWLDNQFWISPRGRALRALEQPSQPSVDRWKGEGGS